MEISQWLREDALAQPIPQRLRLIQAAGTFTDAYTGGWTCPTLESSIRSSGTSNGYSNETVVGRLQLLALKPTDTRQALNNPIGLISNLIHILKQAPKQRTIRILQTKVFFKNTGSWLSSLERGCPRNLRDLDREPDT
jgi:hypothetical protein